VRLHEKGGKEHEAPASPSWKPIWRSTSRPAGIAGDKDGPPFRTTERSPGTPHRLTQQDAYRLIQRHAKRAGIKTRIGNHSMRATGITDYLTEKTGIFIDTLTDRSLDNIQPIDPCRIRQSTIDSFSWQKVLSEYLKLYHA